MPANKNLKMKKETVIVLAIIEKNLFAWMLYTHIVFGIVVDFIAVVWEKWFRTNYLLWLLDMKYMYGKIMIEIFLFFFIKNILVFC